MTGPRKPDLFLVGAPRCGTSAMHDFLQQHPDIFMSTPKEPNFFGSDVDFRFVTPPPPTEAEYLALFADARAYRRAGESSVKYLCSERAAVEIRDFCGNASILIMLRNPVDMMLSLHSRLVNSNQEDLLDFAQALDAEGERRQGRRLPSNFLLPVKLLLYREMASYTEQVRRYFDAFGRDHVLVLIYDDFRGDVGQAYQRTLEFLDVERDFQPNFQMINRNKRPHSRMLQKVLMNARLAQWLAGHRQSRLSPVLRRVEKTMIAALNWNLRDADRIELLPELRQQIQLEFALEVESLSQLLDRDLTGWTRAT